MNRLCSATAPTIHRTDQKLRVHAFYCVLALMILNLLRRKLAKSGIALSMVEMMKQFTSIQEITVLYPALQRGQHPLARVVLSKLNPRQQKIVAALGPDRYRSS
jgi:hypothetical protein